MLKTDTIQITPEILNLIARIDEFKGASYLKRYDLLCQRLVQEQLYTTAAVIAAERSAVDTGDFTNLSDMTSLKAFITSLAGHVASTAARLG